MPRVLITPTTLKHIHHDGPHMALLRKAGIEIVTPPEPWDHQLVEEEVIQLLHGIDATIAGMEPYTERVFAAHPQLKVVARVGVGYDAVDVAAATRHGVAVTITPGTNHETVAELTFALLLALTKQITTDDRQMRQGIWHRHVTIPVRGSTLGIVGLGRIGKAIAVRAQAFGMKVQAFEVQPDQEFVKQQGIRLVDLPTLLQTSDVVSLHAPATPETKHLINRQTLAMMKPTAFLINTARGGLIDEPALVEALKNGKLAGAGLDVFAEEPPAKDHPFYQLDNIVMTPHTGGTDTKSRIDMAELAAKAVVELLAGRWPEELVVNKDVRVSYARK
ncbi:MAG: phosphoglycerate dehydrogenase [Planctomycetia bacterium]|nr:phosphoglycerate dehydrogenase [Planctomycetia bacterium]